MPIPAALRAWALIVPLLLAGLAAGCFDYDVELALTREGHGSMEVRLALPEKQAAAYEVGQLGTIVFPIPQRSRRVENGNLVISEKNGFQDLDDLAARRVRFQVEEVGTGVLGMSAYTYRVTAYLELAEGDLPDRQVLPGTELEERAVPAAPKDPTQERLRKLRARTLGNHHLTMALRFPGKVELARPLVIGASRVEAAVDMEGARASWKVPLSVLVSENARTTLVFSADFKGRLEFRGYEQSKAFSHYPDAYDEALGRGENPPGGRANYLKRLGIIKIDQK